PAHACEEENRNPASPRQRRSRREPLPRALSRADRLAVARRLPAGERLLAFDLHARHAARNLRLLGPAWRAARVGRNHADDLAVVHAAADRARSAAPGGPLPPRLAAPPRYPRRAASLRLRSVPACRVPWRLRGARPGAARRRGDASPPLPPRASRDRARSRDAPVLAGSRLRAGRCAAARPARGPGSASRYANRSVRTRPSRVS